MAIKSTKKVLASILSLAMISQPFCGAKDFIENKNIPQKSSVVKKSNSSLLEKIKKHPVKAAVGGVAAATPVLIGLGLAINYLVSGHGKVIDVKRDELDENDYKLIEKLDKDDKANALTMKDVDDYVKGNHDKFVIYEDGTLEILDENITKIGPFAFYKTNITKIKIPNSVTKIGKGAFAGCTSLNSVIIPNSVEKIGEGAFAGCTSLNSVIIPNSVEKIGEGAFYGCTSLNSVTIPNSVEKIGKGAFQDCKNLGEVKFEEKSQLKEIGGGAFEGCTSLNSVIIPNSVTKIGEGAFRDCKSLGEVKFEEKSQLKEIGKYAFGNTSLNSVTIPNSVTKIGLVAFCNTSLKNVTIPNKCEYNAEGWSRSFPANCKVIIRNETN